MTSPNPTSVQKIACQLATARICAPAIGPSRGATAITVISVDRTRASRSRS
nr:hypothetical protein [Wenxinia saemankumensis]